MKTLIQFVFCLITVLKMTGAVEIIYAQVGQTVALNAKQASVNSYFYWTFGLQDGPQVAWMNPHGGKQFASEEIWKNKLSMPLNSLTITNIQEENFGDFFCKVTKITKVISVTHFRVVKVSVDVTVPSPVMPGERVTLTCKTSQEPPKIFWIGPLGEKMTTNQGTYTMTAESQHSGEWTCVVDQTNKFTILVAVADISAPTYQYTSINSPFKVPVSIKPTNFVQQIIQKIKKIEWHFVPKASSSQSQETLFRISGNDQMREELDQRNMEFKNFTKEGEVSLYKEKAEVEDRGNYNCSVTLRNGFMMSSTVQVEVLQILPSPGVELISGHQLNLSCSIGAPLLPGLHVKWFHPKKSTLLNADPPSDHLIIPKVSTDDSGTWRCALLQNDTQLTSAEITLKIDPLLSAWMVVTICSAAVILILLLVVGFVLCQRRRQRSRHIRHRLCQCKHPKPKGFYKT
ncbi:CD4-1 molecule isoform X1 [Nothobranchius furzeri]|nr:transcript variant X1 [Nothobranchius furzeri]